MDWNIRHSYYLYYNDIYDFPANCFYKTRKFNRQICQSHPYDREEVKFDMVTEQ